MRANDFTRACIFFAACVVVGTPILLLFGGCLAQAVRAAWADGTGLDALATLAIAAAVAAAGALVLEAVRD